MSYDFGYDPEVPAGFQDADILQAQYEQESRVYWRDQQRMEKLLAAGELEAAAEACHHSGGYPLDSLAAEHAEDPAQGEPGYRCADCGSRLTGSPFGNPDVKVTHPCETRA